MDPNHFKEFMDRQRKAIDDYKWSEGCRIGKDPGPAAIEEWIKKNAKTFRKNFAIGDLKQSLQELQLIRNDMNVYFQKITTIVNDVNHLTQIINKCESKIIDGIELLETELDNS
jgi:hypothetical protein